MSAPYLTIQDLIDRYLGTDKEIVYCAQGYNSAPTYYTVQDIGVTIAPNYYVILKWDDDHSAGYMTISVFCTPRGTCTCGCGYRLFADAKAVRLSKLKYEGGAEPLPDLPSTEYKSRPANTCSCQGQKVPSSANGKPFIYCRGCGKEYIP